MEVKKRVSLLHRTATTFYPCCIPALGRFEGAGRTGLTLRESTEYDVKKNISLTFFISS